MRCEIMVTARNPYKLPPNTSRQLCSHEAIGIRRCKNMCQQHINQYDRELVRGKASLARKQRLQGAVDKGTAKAQLKKMTEQLQKEAWVWKDHGDKYQYEYHIESQDFFWYGYAESAGQARIKGWRAFLNTSKGRQYKEQENASN